ncbi:MAG TPA: metallophosphoesterase [Sphingomonas sp.]|nr:metallophosphoesterase [Sphingomonas sp.]
MSSGRPGVANYAMMSEGRDGIMKNRTGFVVLGDAGVRRIDGQLVYAVGDIHGRYDLLEGLLRRIVADAATAAHGRRPVLVFCGDYIDRGPASADVLAALAWLRTRADYELHLLIGNHEQAMLRYLVDPEEGRPWLGFGGAETLESYGISAPDVADEPADHLTARDRLLDTMPASHLVLLQSLETIVTIGDYAFCHAGIRPGRRLADQTVDDLLWIREPFLGATRSFEKMIVHGHSWDGPEPVVRSNRIGIDTGAYQTGVLTCLRIEDQGWAVMQEEIAPDQLSR